MIVNREGVYEQAQTCPFLFPIYGGGVDWRERNLVILNSILTLYLVDKYEMLGVYFIVILYYLY